MIEGAGSLRRLRIGSFTVLCAVLCSTGFVGCSETTLPYAPTMYSDGTNPFDQLETSRRTPEFKVYYATDRKSTSNPDGTTTYGNGRSTSMAIGAATVRLGPEQNWNWDELVEASLDRNSSTNVPLRITAVNEAIRFPSSSPPRKLVDGQIVKDQAVEEERMDAAAYARELIAAEVAMADRKEIFLFVHGIQNSFESPVYRIAQIWHMMGRTGVPIAYAWPSHPGRGALRGYTYDRESGEFTVYHLRQFLRLLASVPELEKIHILAHSRGTDVTLTALREISLIEAGRGRSPREVLKLGNLILAAPDLDLEVTIQRTNPDNVTAAAERLTIYVSERDEAIGIASWLFGSVGRLGRLRSDEISPERRETLFSPRFDIVDVRARDLGEYKHNYFVENPAALSDIILLLRDNRIAGAEHGRPLVRDESGFWLLYDGYPVGGRHMRELDKPQSSSSSAERAALEQDPARDFE
ncbi:MAG: alpha/beta hydrolase [Planctomycetota bacterium]